YCGRASQKLSRGKILSTDPPECAPVFPVPGDFLSSLSLLGCLAGDVVQGSGHGERKLRDRRGDDCPGGQCRAVERLYFWLPFFAPFVWWKDRSIIAGARAAASLRMHQLPQSAAYALGLDQFVLGDVRGRVRPALLDGRMAGYENSLKF